VEGSGGSAVSLSGESRGPPWDLLEGCFGSFSSFPLRFARKLCCVLLYLSDEPPALLFGAANINHQGLLPINVQPQLISVRQPTLPLVSVIRTDDIV
jgi:hypothetical protein